MANGGDLVGKHVVVALALSAQLPEQYRRDRAEITNRVRLRRGTVRISDGERWIDHRCLFHDDSHQSASWQEDTGVYICRTESKTFAVPLVLEMLGLGTAPAPGTRRRAAAGLATPAPPKPPRNKALAIAYPYHFPDGRLSHVKYRVGDGQSKTIWQEGPAGEPSLPASIYPIYSRPLSVAGHLIVVEGEKCVDIVTDVAEHKDDVEIDAITCGSASDTRKHATLLAERIRDLAPNTVTLWPDFDEPGFRAMEAVSQSLLALGVPHYVVKPDELGLPAKGDVVDYILAGGRLRDVVRKGQLPQSNGDPSGMVSRLVVTQDGHVVFPNTRNLITINQANATAIYYHEAHAMPKDAQAKELSARLLVKSQIMPTTVVPRQLNALDETWWRPRSHGPAYHISANGAELSDDPPGYFLKTPSDELPYSPDVNLDGTEQDLLDLGAAFHLTSIELTMIEGWLTCAIAGLQTPILFMRAPAGTGKTTLARLLLSVIEPLCPEIDTTKGLHQDMRELTNVFRSSQAVLLDNISRLNAGLEDQLSKLVTGYTTVQRTLYSDVNTTVHLKRALIITTTNYDVYKGDLAQRMVVAQPSTESAFKWLPDSVAQARFARFIPRIRGYIFNRLAAFYRKRPELDPDSIRFRIGDLGLVFAALGYDTAELAELEAAAKSEIIATDDSWLEAMVELWKDEQSTWFFKSTADLLKHMHDFGIKELPPEKSPRLARYLSEKNPIFADHGFSVTKVSTGKVRGYRFAEVERRDVNPELDIDSEGTSE